MSNSEFGIDMGTYDIKIYDAKANEFYKHKNAIAIRKIMNRKHVFAVGDDAYEMYARCPRSIQVLFPMQGGVVSDFDAMQYLLQDLVWGDQSNFFGRAEYLLAAPTDITEVEKKAFLDLIMQSQSKAKNVRLVPRAIADAIGMGVNIFKPDGAYVINLGGATTEFSIIASGGMVINKMERFGGRQLDEAIVSSIRKEYGFITGFFSSEHLKNTIGSAYGVEEESIFVPGRSLVSGLPGEIQISSHEVYTAMKPFIDQIVETASGFLDRIPKEMADNICEDGIYLTGGVANMKNIDKLISREIGIPVHSSETPELTTILGLRKIMKNNAFDSVVHSVLEDRPRWK